MASVVVQEFEKAAWADPAQLEQFVASVASLDLSETKKMLAILTNIRTASDAAAHRKRCVVFGRLAAKFPHKEMFLEFVQVLKGEDPQVRALMALLLPAVNNVTQHPELCAVLRHGNPDVRRAAAGVLRQIGGKTVFRLLGEFLTERVFAGRIEAMDILVGVAGHHAIPSLAPVLATGTDEDKMHVLALLSDARYMAAARASAIKAILPALRDLNEEVVVRAVQAINAEGAEDDFFVHLEPRLDAANLRLTRAILEGLKRFNSPRAINTLQERFRAGPNKVRLIVLEILEQIGTTAIVPILVEAANSRYLQVRTSAAGVLSNLGKSGKIDPAITILGLLRSSDEVVRRIAADVAANMGKADTELWKRLLGYLRDEDWWVRERVMDALLQMTGSELSSHVLWLLNDPSEVVRRFAVNALMRLKPPEALQPLAKAATSDPDWWVQELSIEAIGVLGDKRAVPFLLERLFANEDTRLVCIRALAALGDPSAAPHLAKLLAAAEPDLRMAALQALATLNDREQRLAIQPLTEDPDVRVRAFARELLGRWGLNWKDAQTGAIGRALSPLDQLLVSCAQASGDDLILLAWRPPTVKSMGVTVALSDNLISADDMEKLIYPCLTSEQKEDLKALRDVDFSYEVRSEGLRFRVNVFRHTTGLGAVFRIIKGEVPDIEKLGLPPIVQGLGDLKNGLVLVGGPTGAGKSTTLAALIDSINRKYPKHILTIEDPIEVIHQGKRGRATQRELGTHARSFTSALRSTLREDPDVILVGELRDLETISFAVTAAETGHLVLGTVHAVSADSVVDRLINAFPAGQQPQVRSMLASSLRAVICQYLIPKKDGSGRTLAIEIMLNTDAVSNLIRKGKAFQISSVIATSRTNGMQLMDVELTRLYQEGVITAEDAYMKARSKKDFEKMLAESADAASVAAGVAASATNKQAGSPNAAPRPIHPAAAAPSPPGAVRPGVVGTGAPARPVVPAPATAQAATPPSAPTARPGVPGPNPAAATAARPTNPPGPGAPAGGPPAPTTATGTK